MEVCYFSSEYKPNGPLVLLFDFSVSSIRPAVMAIAQSHVSRDPVAENEVLSEGCFVSKPVKRFFRWRRSVFGLTISRCTSSDASPPRRSRPPTPATVLFLCRRWLRWFHRRCSRLPLLLETNTHIALLFAAPGDALASPFLRVLPLFASKPYAWFRFVPGRSCSVSFCSASVLFPGGGGRSAWRPCCASSTRRT